jgi:phenylpropionate dioxygenase-like ring-hydroxylating dioxygenase large terminal subunit
MEHTNLQISSHNWFVAARSDQLPVGALVRRLILGRPYVLFRGADGAPAALEDSCPHKNLPLSMGKLVGGQIQCRYHGWRFARDGRCTDVPCHAPDEKLPACRVPALRVVEQDGWVWLYPGVPTDAAALPPRHPRDRRHRWFELHNVMRAPVDLIIENGVDCGHTGFVHPGLYRSIPQQFIRALVKTTPTGVRIDTLDEQAETGTRDFRSLLSRNQKITHSDELILPHTVRVDYQTSNGLSVITILVCTPEDEHTTRVYTRMGVSYGVLTIPATWFVKRLTERIVAQDKEVLEGQADNIQRLGGRKFRTVTADLPTNWVQRAIRQFNQGTFTARDERREISYKL